jgi:hypothetical protein
MLHISAPECQGSIQSAPSFVANKFLVLPPSGVDR